jgi:hypothetical protein
MPVRENSVVIVLGAGATLADGVGRPAKRQAPLDRGFLSNVLPLMVLSFDRLPSTCRSTTVQTFERQIRMGFCHPRRFPANMRSA